MIKEMIGSGKGLVYALLALASFAPLGCNQGSDPEEGIDVPAQIVEEICKQMCTCRGGCDASQMKDCTDGGFELRDEANAAGCTSDWMVYTDCLYTYPACDNGQVVPGQCGDEMVTLQTCVDAAKPMQITCEDVRVDINGVWEMCGIQTGPYPCEGDTQDQLACEDQCARNVASCDVVDGTLPALDDCLAMCTAM